jgi:importin subunit beta-1
LIRLAQEQTTQTDLLERWRALSSETRQHIKTLSLQTLHSADKRASGVAATAIASIAAAELPYGEWNDLIGTLLGFVGGEAVGLKVATLQTIGFICETIVSVQISKREKRGRSLMSFMSVL